MDEKQALAYASNILRTISADDFTKDSSALLYSARQLDAFAKDMGQANEETAP